MEYIKIKYTYDALDCLHWLVDALPPEAWEALPEALQDKILTLTKEQNT